MSFQCKDAATSIRNSSAHPICSRLDLVWGKQNRQSHVLVMDCTGQTWPKGLPFCQTATLRTTMWPAPEKHKFDSLIRLSHEKNNLGYLRSIESWLVHRDPYNCLSLFPHKWVGWHPLCALDNQIFFHCSIEKKNSSRSCSTIPLSKNCPPNSTTMNRMGFSSMVLDFRILKNNGLNSGLKLKIFKPWIAGSILLPSIPTQLPFFALQVALDLGPQTSIITITTEKPRGWNKAQMIV